METFDFAKTILVNNSNNLVSKMLLTSSSTARNIKNIFKDYIGNYKDTNIHQELNLNVSSEEWRQLLLDLNDMSALMGADESKFLKNEIQSSSDKKVGRVLQLILLAELLSYTSTLNQSLKDEIINNMSETQDFYSEKYGYKNKVNVEEVFRDNELWSGRKCNERLMTGAKTAVTGFIALMIFGLSRKDKNLVGQIDNKVKNWIKNTTQKIVVTEQVANMGFMTIDLMRVNGVEDIQFKSMEDGGVCKFCSSFEDEIFTIDEAPILPLHPNGRCYYIPYEEEK